MDADALLASGLPILRYPWQYVQYVQDCGTTPIGTSAPSLVPTDLLYSLLIGTACIATCWCEVRGYVRKESGQGRHPGDTCSHECGMYLRVPCAEANTWVPELANPTSKLAADTSRRKAARLDMSALCVPRATFILCPRKRGEDVETENSLATCAAPFTLRMCGSNAIEYSHQFRTPEGHLIPTLRYLGLWSAVGFSHHLNGKLWVGSLYIGG